MFAGQKGLSGNYTSFSKLERSTGFVPFDPNHQNLLRAIQLTAANNLSPIHGRINTFTVQSKLANGIWHQTKEDYATVKHQDTADIVAHYKDGDGITHIGLTHNLRVPVLQRDLATYGKIIRPLEPSLLGGYLLLKNGKLGLSEIAGSLVEEKLGTIAVGAAEFLGGSYYISGSNLTELGHPRAIPVAPPPCPKQMKFANKFQSAIISEFVPLQEVVNRYFRKSDDGLAELRDLRALETVFRFARFNNESISLPFKVDLSNSTCNSFTATLRIFSKDSALAELIGRDRSDKTVTEIRLLPTRTTEHEFLSFRQLSVAIERNDGTREAPFIAEVLERKGLDSLDGGAYCVIDNEPYILVTSGIRNLTVFRNTQFHPLAHDENPRFIDGLQFKLESGINPLAGEAQKKALINFLESRGLIIEGSPLHLNDYFVSLGWANEKVSQYLTRVSPDFRKVKDDAPIYLVRPKDILALSDAGELPSARLSCLAHILLFAQEAPVSFSPLSKDDLRYLEIINQAPAIHSTLSEIAPRIHAKLLGHDQYRKLLAHSGNEQGLTFLKANEVAHPEEAKFFNEAFPVVILFQSASSFERMPINVWHDTSHYLEEELIPFKFDEQGKLKLDDSGRPQMITVGEYINFVRALEAEANYNSDFLATREVGIQLARELTPKRAVVYESFAKLAMLDDEVRAALHEIEVNGRIPKVILDSPHFNDPEFRKVFVNRFLYYHVLDEFQAKIAYDAWKRYPRLAEIAVNFRGFTPFSEDFLDNYLERLSELHEYPEGINNLKSAISRCQNVELKLLAMNIGFYRELLNEQSSRGQEEAAALLREATLQIESLIAANIKLSGLKREINTPELCERNVNAMLSLEEIQQDVVAPAKAFLENLRDQEKFFPNAKFGDLKARIFPFLKPPATFNPEDVEVAFKRKCKQLGV